MGTLIAFLPGLVLAQSQSQQPPAEDDQVIAAPLPDPSGPADAETEAPQDMVPNPLRDPAEVREPGSGSNPPGIASRGVTPPGVTPPGMPPPGLALPGLALPGPGGGKPAREQPLGQPQGGSWVQMGTASLQALDKVNARAGTLLVKVGETAHFGSLDIAVRGCFVRSPDRPADATALLVIRDQRADAPAFSGWIVRSAPYLSMLAHPIYDVRVTGCSP